MTIPFSYIEQYRSGDQQNASLRIRKPITLEATGYVGDKPKPKGPFAFMADSTRGHITAMLGEFLGTMMFLFFGFIAAQTANEKKDMLLRSDANATAPPAGPSLLQIAYISAVFGLSLMANVFIWYRVSGGQFNPSVSIGLWLCGAFGWVRLVCVIPMQLLGGIVAAGLVSALLPGPLQAENSLGSGVTLAQGFLMETILTSMLMITILMLAVEKSRVSFMAPLVIGVALVIIHLVGINVSGASVNPARSLGPAVINNNFVPEFWIYYTGPTLGAVIAAAVHSLLKAMAYRDANEGQDGDGMDFYRVVPAGQEAPSSSSGHYYSESYSSPAVKAPAPAMKQRSLGYDPSQKKQLQEDEVVLLRVMSGRERRDYIEGAAK